MDAAQQLKVEQKVKDQAHKLGGGWRMEHGLMPVVVLTTVEAEAVLERIENPSQRDLLGVQYKEPDGKTLFLHPNDVTLIYSTDGI